MVVTSPPLALTASYMPQMSIPNRKRPVRISPIVHLLGMVEVDCQLLLCPIVRGKRPLDMYKVIEVYSPEHQPRDTSPQGWKKDSEWTDEIIKDGIVTSGRQTKEAKTLSSK